MIFCGRALGGSASVCSDYLCWARAGFDDFGGDSVVRHACGCG